MFSMAISDYISTIVHWLSSLNCTELLIAAIPHAAEWTKRKQNAFIVATVVHREIDVMCIDAQSQCRTIIHSVAVTR